MLQVLNQSLINNFLAAIMNHVKKIKFTTARLEKGHYVKILVSSRLGCN